MMMLLNVGIYILRDVNVSYLQDIVEYEECCHVLVGQLLNVVICWSLMKGLSLT